MSRMTRGKGGDALLQVIRDLSKHRNDEYYYGKVTSLAPFKVRLEGDTEDLDEDVVIWSRDVQEYASGVGEDVLVLVFGEGQKFFVAARVVV